MRIGAQTSNDAHGKGTNDVHAQKLAHPKDVQDVQDLLYQLRLLCRVLRTLGPMSSCRQTICLSPYLVVCAWAVLCCNPLHILQAGWMMHFFTATAFMQIKVLSCGHSR